MALQAKQNINSRIVAKERDGRDVWKETGTELPDVMDTRSLLSGHRNHSQSYFKTLNIFLSSSFLGYCHAATNKIFSLASCSMFSYANVHRAAAFSYIHQVTMSELYTVSLFWDGHVKTGVIVNIDSLETVC